MNLLNNVNLGTKLGIMLVIPLLGLVFFSGKQFLAAQQTSQEAASMRQLTQVAVAVNQLLDDLRLENDITIKYQKARLKKFVSETESSRLQSAQSIENLLQISNGLAPGAFGDQFSGILNQAFESLAEIEEKRTAIDGKKLRRDKTAKYFARLNHNLLHIVEQLPGLSSSKESALLSNAYAIFLHIKDLAAQERQILANVFKRDQFVGKEFADLNNAANGQKVYQAMLLTLLSAEQSQFYNETIRGEFVKQTSEMREKAFLASDYGAFNIDPEHWVNQQTGKIALINQVADKLTANLKAKTNQMAETANATLMSASIISLLAILITVVLGYIIQKGIRDSVESTLKIVGKIAEGDLSNEIIVNTRDEMGEILRSIGKMQTDLKQKIDKEARVSLINARIKQALDNVSANVLVANAKNKVIYCNDAAIQMFTTAESSIKQEVTDFSAGSILGSDIRVFQQLAQYKQSATSKLDMAHESSFLIGGRTFRFVINPILSQQSERLGTVLECQDRTEEVGIEQQIETMVIAVQQGNLAHQLDSAGKQGFFLNLTQGMNAMVDTIASTLEDLNQVMSALAQGDLSRNIEKNYQGTFGEVSQNVNRTIDQFANVVAQILESSDEMESTSKEIETGNNDLSSRTEQQATALEQTATSMEEITSTVKQNADNANQANSLASQARNTAEKGGDVVNQAVVAMTEINQASTRIAEIIGVIDEIAFQTNLLALNASVEAARAGEQGRGFAVVATEVRNLAGRSATAAKEIKELIHDSVTKVTTGSELVNQSGETLQEIVQDVKKLGDIVGEIAAAGEEQAKGIEQVNNAVSKMDEATQQNAALAEQTSAASVSMRENTENMAQHVEFFTLSENVNTTRNLEIKQAHQHKDTQDRNKEEIKNQQGASLSQQKTPSSTRSEEPFRQ